MPDFKAIRRFLSIGCLIVYLFATESVLSYVLETQSYSSFYNYEMKQIEDQGTEINMIFIGASRVYRSFVPEIFETELGVSNVLNAGTSSQLISSTYYYLKYLLSRFSPEYIVVGVTWDQLLVENDTQAKLIVKDRMKMSLDKLRYEQAAFNLNEKIYLLNSYRYREYLDPELIQKNLEDRRELKRNAYRDVDEGIKEYYADSGFVYSYRSVREGNIPLRSIGGFERNNIKEESLEYLNKITQLCKEKNIQLFLVSAPITTARMYQIEHYQDAVEYYKTYAQENGLVYHNLNYLKGREVFLPDAYMHDSNHVNGKGAEVTSLEYAEVLKRALAGEDTSEYFYKDFEEFSKSVERVVAVGADMELQGNQLNVTVDSLQNIDETPEYEILLSVDGGEYNVMQEYSTKTEYTIERPECTKYTIRVNARRVGSDAEYEAYQEYEY